MNSSKWLPDNTHLIVRTFGLDTTSQPTKVLTSLYSVDTANGKVTLLDKEHPFALIAPYIFNEDGFSTGVEPLY